MGSFLLPLDPHVADDFFLDPKEKLKRWGKDSNIPEVRDLADLLNKTRSKSASPPPPAPPSESCQPVNMRLRNVDAELLHAILSNVHPAEKVRDEMVVRVNSSSDMLYIKMLKDYLIDETSNTQSIVLATQ